MAIRAEKTEEFEHPLVEQESSSKFGWLATLAVLTIVGLVAWFILNSDGDEI